MKFPNLQSFHFWGGGGGGGVLSRGTCKSEAQLCSKLDLKFSKLHLGGGGVTVALVPVWGKVALLALTFGTRSVLGPSQ